MIQAQNDDFLGKEKKTMAKKVTEMPAGHPDYEVKQKVATHKHVVAMVSLKPGAAVPEHSHSRGYVVHPLTKGQVKKTTYRKGKVVKEETIKVVPGQPYYVPPTRPGETISSKNTGRQVITFGKIVDPADPDMWNFPANTKS
jgi:quercetin dioxygenase-like cupin family protein